MGGVLGRQKAAEAAPVATTDLSLENEVREAAAAAEGAGAGDGAPHQNQSASNLRQIRKKKALAACGELHGDLLDCFQKASMFTFKPICQEENNAFWDCYKRERGLETAGSEKEMSFQQMFEDVKAYVAEAMGK